MQAVYVVKGMTCGHCASSVTEEVSQIPAVRDVRVDLATGHVTVSSESVLDTVDVTRAVSEAGYELTGRV
ncbi:heavy-metal-associated domain-containing protein [Kibdelosporangium phytohabitans]|uniref:heavy-metal-associated domain-containing protein n=1 Tax=Kibdelosporangium phytohabitans TaxID=860235 RepID=UPI0014701AF0|nr:heavy-metal-associated domain-containing protein [Kibdelosporangium phytohabitans]